VPACVSACARVMCYVLCTMCSVLSVLWRKREEQRDKENGGVRWLATRRQGGVISSGTETVDTALFFSSSKGPGEGEALAKEEKEPANLFERDLI
jgi:hypothetical protein